ncbi:hypothetical protein VOLCADRAFT_108376 [Volvox carteri f. nagariensis]|uniref:Mitochondrial glyco protein n=1 Tax=Volvox carteri f. nagariensis TaxID=3068 RepID=D8UJS3_VOLCA|nr:uncharacterized protein VOLCADRAFT_108376 [Volvox carteri f. nagariensis]EFJ40026.1 hypothetical protein VOLCADRAFT_108376 [Volvox carteri f. nagariensis]|eukprot:XP_002958895.1 hypothetical protein VOLCADRAFT_108376 [Volvox carteri f. nagariensis]
MTCKIVRNLPTMHQCRIGPSRGLSLPSLPQPCSSPSTRGRQALGQAISSHTGRRHCIRGTSRMATNATGKRSTSSVSNSLIAVLKDEIKYERESYRRSELIIGDPPNDFELQDARGTTWFVLAKEFENEEIIVRVDLDAQPILEEEEEGEEYEDEDEQEPSVEFQVTIAKEGDDTLIFECESNGEYLTISRVALDGIYEDSDGPPAYKGPVFQDLDDTLQQAFVDFLEERGVNAYLGEYIRVYLEDKATLEYQQWLNRVREFIGR